MRRHELVANAIIHFPLIVIAGMFLVAMYPANLVLMFLLYVCGVIDLVYAKMPLLRHRVFASFGPSQIPAGRRDAYFRGYKRLLLGAAFNVLVLVHYAVMAGST
jgi:hypothetical protein